MKKMIVALLAFAVILGASACVMAGTFDGYSDFEQADGTYAYAFLRVKVTMDKDWYRKTRVVLGEGGQTASFYHKGSYNAYADEGLTGGLLFTIGASVNTDFQELPRYNYIGFDEDEAMNYYVARPTDYQAYMADETIRKEYDELWDSVGEVIANIEILGSDQPDQTDASAGKMMGGWEVTEDASVTKEAQAVFDQAMPDHDRVVYDAVALLATQVVAGKNFCILRRTSVIDSDEAPTYQLVYLWRDLQGKVQVLDIQEIEFGLSKNNSDQKTEVSGAEEYSIMLSGEEDVFTDCPISAKAGDTVIVHTVDVADGEVKITVNGEDAGSWQDWGTYTFVMPDQDVELYGWISTEGFAGA